MKLLVFALLCCLCVPAHAGENSAKVLGVASSYLHVREKTGHNDAPEITAFLKYAGLPPQLAYCLAFDVYCWGQVQKPNPFPRLGGTIRFWEYINDHPLRYRIYRADDLLNGRGREMTGGIGIYFHTTRTGHAFLFDHQINRKAFATIEGNTVGTDSTNAAEQRGEGSAKKQGVFRRVRSTDVRGMTFKGIAVPR